MAIDRPEYPRPQLVREPWVNLNGIWEFETDNAGVGLEKAFYQRGHFAENINVPFCPESKLSGIGNTDFMNCVWYRRELEIPEGWNGRRILLHFGAVDYHATVYINGIKAGEHTGGYTPFCFDITGALKEAGNAVILCAQDDIRSGKQPGGKQSERLASYGCSYTRTTGIWQTVWMEAVGEAYVKNIRYYPNISACQVNVELVMAGNWQDASLKAEAYYEGKKVGEAETDCVSQCPMLTIPLSERHLWSAGEGNLYDVKVTLSRAAVMLDEITSYFGLREVGLSDRAFLLNGKPVFGRWVLDQGFYPDGIYTAPSDAALKQDILDSMKLGFNGARLHEKIFEPRFLYWADRLGYLVWDEHANWGQDFDTIASIEHFLPEWLEVIERDFSHPSVIGWCPMNEVWAKCGKAPCSSFIKLVYEATKAADSTRPVIDTSGGYHGDTDIFDIHDYTQDPSEFKAKFNPELLSPFPEWQTYQGEPYFVSEYGGIKWDATGSSDGWGYGNAPQTKEEFMDRYRGLTEALLQDERILGFCYTQLYDVEQEINGLLTYDRKFKFDPGFFYKVNTQPAAIEQMIPTIK